LETDSLMERSSLQNVWFHVLTVVNEEFYILICNTLHSVESQLTFWRNMSPPSSHQALLKAGFLFDLLSNPDDWCDMFLLDVSRLSMHYTVLYPIMQASSYVTLFSLLSVVCSKAYYKSLFLNHTRLHDIIHQNISIAPITSNLATFNNFKLFFFYFIYAIHHNAFCSHKMLLFL
jgi:hypothetical protein